jgi:hypothetical protein
MKKWLALLSIFALICSSSCSGMVHTYEEGYDDGYENGYREGRYEGYDEGEFYGYEEGYEDGSEDDYFEWYDDLPEYARYLEDEAVHYAAENGGWHPEEAGVIIDAYINGKSVYGSMPSKEEYREAVESLWYFYDYFYSAMYND